MLCPRLSPNTRPIGVSRRNMPNWIDPLGGQEPKRRCCSRAQRRDRAGRSNLATEATQPAGRSVTEPLGQAAGKGFRIPVANQHARQLKAVAPQPDVAADVSARQDEAGLTDESDSGRRVIATAAERIREPGRLT